MLNVASLAAFQPVPLLATYAASKVYVLSLTESPPEEFKCSGVTVTALCSCITATPMLQAATQGNQQLAQLPGLLIGDVDNVARQGFEACVKGEVIGVPGVVNQAPCRPAQHAQMAAASRQRLFGAHGKLNRILGKCLCCFRGATLRQNRGWKY